MDTLGRAFGSVWVKSLKSSAPSMASKSNHSDLHQLNPPWVWHFSKAILPPKKKLNTTLSSTTPLPTMTTKILPPPPPPPPLRLPSIFPFVTSHFSNFRSPPLSPAYLLLSTPFPKYASLADFLLFSFFIWITVRFLILFSVGYRRFQDRPSFWIIRLRSMLHREMPISREGDMGAVGIVRRRKICLLVWARFLI